MVVAREYPAFEGTLRIVPHGRRLGLVPCIELFFISAFVSASARIHPFSVSMIEGRQESAPPNHFLCFQGGAASECCKNGALTYCRLQQIKRPKR